MLGSTARVSVSVSVRTTTKCACALAMIATALARANRLVIPSAHSQRARATPALPGSPADLEEGAGHEDRASVGAALVLARARVFFSGCEYVCTCACVCLRACVRACVCMCMCVSACVCARA